MKRFITVSLVSIALAVAVQSGRVAQVKGDDFVAVVKVIEQFYHVKHKGIPFLARAGIKTATTAARIGGGTKRQLAAAGSVRVAYFEDQDFNSNGSNTSFKASMDAVLADSWSPLIRVTSPKDAEQTYIFLRDAGEKFNVLVVTIERREACVVQVNLSPRTLAKLMQDPDEMGKAITIDATTDDESRRINNQPSRDRE